MKSITQQLIEVSESIKAEKKEIVDSGLLESWVNLHRNTSPENRKAIKVVITTYDLNDAANEAVRKAHKKPTE